MNSSWDHEAPDESAHTLDCTCSRCKLSEARNQEAYEFAREQNMLLLRAAQVVERVRARQADRDERGAA